MWVKDGKYYICPFICTSLQIKGQTVGYLPSLRHSLVLFCQKFASHLLEQIWSKSYCSSMYITKKQNLFNDLEERLSNPAQIVKLRPRRIEDCMQEVIGIVQARR